MPPATSKREAALANIKTVLETIVSGASYNFTMDKVARVDGPFFIWLDDSYNTVAFIEEGLTSWLRLTHGGLWQATVEVFVQAATKYEPDHPNPFLATTESKSTLRSKLIADVVRALTADNIRGGNAKLGFELTDDAPINLDGIDSEGVWTPDRWTAHEFRFEMSVEVNQAAP